MNVLGKIQEFKEKQRMKRISSAQAKAETKRVELKRIKEESDAVRELRRQELAVSKEREYLKKDRLQNGFFGQLSKLKTSINDKPVRVKATYNAPNILKNNESVKPIDDRYQPRGIFSSGKKPKSPFM